MVRQGPAETEVPRYIFLSRLIIHDSVRTWLAVAIVLLGAVFVAPTPDALASPAWQLLATVGGQPDDVTVDARGRLVWGNLQRGTIESLIGGRIVTVARGLSVPEGVVALPAGDIIVAEQGLDRITRISRKGKRRVIFALQPVSGQDGVDGIGVDPRTGQLLVPDSPRGTVLRMSVSGKGARQIAQGLGRPVDAAMDTHGNVLVPDEHLGTLVMIAPNGKVTQRGSFATPDDVAVDARGRIWVTSLGDGGLWEFIGAGAPTLVLGGLANPQGLTLDHCGDPIVVDQNSSRIIRVLLTTEASRCAF